MPDIAGSGRIPKLNAVVGRTDDGKPIRVRDRIIEFIERGAPYNTAAAASGISTSTLHHWLRQAAGAAERVLINPQSRLTPHERDLIVFQRQLDAANATADMRYRKNMDDLATGGLSRSTILVKQQMVDGRMAEVERTSRVERTLPSFAANRWILEDRIGPRIAGVDRVEDGELSDDEALTQLGDAMEHWLSVRDADAPQPADSHSNGSGNGSAAH